MKKMIFVILISGLLLESVFALKIELGKKKEWANVFLRDSAYQMGADGSYDIVLQENEYTFTRDVDLLIHFNGKPGRPWGEHLGNYSIQQKRFAFDNKRKVFGESSGKFAHPKSTLLLRPRESSWFNKTEHAGSFTIEFWMNPSTLSDGEIIFKRYGPVVEEGEVYRYSGIICRIKNNRLRWEFHHFFHSPGGNTTLYDENKTKIMIMGNQRLRRHNWTHHALSFDALNGKMTYFVNGKLEKSLFVTQSGQPEDTVLTPRFYPQEKSMLTIGHQFYGFLDEFMISKVAKTARKKKLRYASANQDKGYFHVEKYTPREGIVTSHVYDLRQSGSFLKRLELNAHQDKGSYIIMEYRMSDHFFTPDKPDNYTQLDRNGQETILAWKTLDTRLPSLSTLKLTTGRYFQWRAVMKSGMSGQFSPVLKDVTFHFDIDHKPASPRELLAFSSKGKIYLKWKGNVERDVNRYKIYFGMESGNYIVQGKKPIEINVNELSDKNSPIYVIKGLKLNQVYYFVITALDRNGHESSLSNEVYVRVRKEN
ncbi:MAG: hypothetical protein OEZ36_02180 [Spirochaetota bacterium]|nr:hypothetical protein [Spirochaetota bacterium]